jgi:glycosyltransferase involved in cell wall biosynthesis
MLDLLLIEPYYGGSHRQWADTYQRHTRHNLTLLTLPAQAWKWRMQGGAVTLARQFAERHLQPDVILASDMIDLSTFRALTRHHTHHTPTALYFHENQLTYPQNYRQNHGWRYGFINYISALAADALYFNSQYHLDVFFDTLPRMLKHFYDFNELDTIPPLRQRAQVLPVGLDLQRYDTHRPASLQPNDVPFLIWNHRWEADKNPLAFLQALDTLLAQDSPFKVAILGGPPQHYQSQFDTMRAKLGDRLVAFGHVDFPAYVRLLWQADYVISTAYQEFFGVAIAEAIYCGCIPILPNRLNYPYLIPPTMRDACLYPHDDALSQWLQRHFSGEYTPDRTALTNHIRRYDWQQITARYDDTLTHLARSLAPG